MWSVIALQTLVNEDLQSLTPSVTTPLKKQSIWFVLNLPKNKKPHLKDYSKILQPSQFSHKHLLPKSSILFIYYKFFGVTSKLCSSNLIVENLQILNFIIIISFLAQVIIFFSKIRQFDKNNKIIIYDETVHVL